MRIRYIACFELITLNFRQHVPQGIPLLVMNPILQMGEKTQLLIMVSCGIFVFKGEHSKNLGN